MARAGMIGDWGGWGSDEGAPISYYTPPPSGDVVIGGGGGGEDPPPVDQGPSTEELLAAQQAKANAEARARSERENANTRALADQQYGLLAGFASARDIKLGNITTGLDSTLGGLLKGYLDALGGLQGAKKDNEKSEADASFGNVANSVRERQDILTQAASQGAGETDSLRAQLAALRNYSANQGEVNRSFFDTLRSINSSQTALNSDTRTSRRNAFNQSEAERERTWADYYNQLSDTWTQIGNLENSNTNIDSDSSVGYVKKYSQWGTEAQKAAGSSYTRQDVPEGFDEWSGQEKAEWRRLNSSNRAAAVTLGPMKSAEGATLRKW